MNKRGDRQLAMTLVELLSVVAIIGILAALAISYSGDWQKRFFLSKTARDTYRVLNLARSEAIKRGRTTTVTISGANVIAFIDQDVDHFYKKDVDQLLLTGGQSRVAMFLSQSITSTTAATIDVGHGNQLVIKFDFEGLCKDKDDAAMAPSLQINDAALTFNHTIDITLAGAIRIAKYK